MTPVAMSVGMTRLQCSANTSRNLISHRSHEVSVMITALVDQHTSTEASQGRSTSPVLFKAFLQVINHHLGDSETPGQGHHIISKDKHSKLQITLNPSLPEFNLRTNSPLHHFSKRIHGLSPALDHTSACPPDHRRNQCTASVLCQ